MRTSVETPGFTASTRIRPALKVSAAIFCLFVFSFTSFHEELSRPVCHPWLVHLHTWLARPGAMNGHEVTLRRSYVRTRPKTPITHFVKKQKSRLMRFWKRPSTQEVVRSFPIGFRYRRGVNGFTNFVEQLCIAALCGWVGMLLLLLWHGHTHTVVRLSCSNYVCFGWCRN